MLKEQVAITASALELNNTGTRCIRALALVRHFPTETSKSTKRIDSFSYFAHVSRDLISTPKQR